jgi:hypothetical protein
MVPDMSLLLSVVALLVAAVLQEMIPALPVLPVKGFFLSAVAFYYILKKPKLMSVVVLLWAGMLTDALGGGPYGCTVTFLLLAYPVLLLLKRVFIDMTLLHGTLLTSLFSAFQQVWMYAWVPTSGISVFSMDMLKLMGAAAALGLMTGLSMFLLCSWLERFKGVAEHKSADLEGMHGIV